MDDRRAARWPAWLLGLGMLLLAVAGMAAGAYLLMLGGSAYYALASGALAVTGVAVLARWRLAAGCYALLLGATLGWALWEVGLDARHLLPRLGLPALLGLVVWLPWFTRGGYAWGRQLLGLTVVSSLALLLTLTLVSPAGTSFLSISEPASPAAAPRDAAATGLHPLWRLDHHTAGEGTASPLPLMVDDQLFVCTARAIEARASATGERRWSYPIGDDRRAEEGGQASSADGDGGQGTCRALAYLGVGEQTLADAEGVFAPTPGEGEPDPLEMAATHEGAGEQGVSESDLVCPRRLYAVFERRLLALDADAGRRCDSFGTNGAVDLAKLAGVEADRMKSDITGIEVTSRLVIITGAGGALVALDSDTGDRVWHWQDLAPGTGGVRVVAVDEPRGLLLVAADGGARPSVDRGDGRSGTLDGPAGRLTALEVATGEVLWTRALDLAAGPGAAVASATMASPSAAVIPRDDGPALVVLATAAAELLLLDASSGKTLASLALGPPAPLAAEPWRTPPADPMVLRERDMWGLTPLDQLLCRIRLRARDRAGPVLLPPTLERWVRPATRRAPHRVALAPSADGQALYASVSSQRASPGHSWLSCRTPSRGELVKVALTHPAHGLAPVWQRSVARQSLPLGMELSLAWPFAGARLSVPVLFEDEVLLGAIGKELEVIGLDAGTGDRQWRRRMTGAVGSLSAVEYRRDGSQVLWVAAVRGAGGGSEVAIGLVPGD